MPDPRQIGALPAARHSSEAYLVPDAWFKGRLRAAFGDNLGIRPPRITGDDGVMHRRMQEGFIAGINNAIDLKPNEVATLVWNRNADPRSETPQAFMVVGSLDETGKFKATRALPVGRDGKIGTRTFTLPESMQNYNTQRTAEGAFYLDVHTQNNLSANTQVSYSLQPAISMEYAGSSRAQPTNVTPPVQPPVQPSAQPVVQPRVQPPVTVEPVTRPAVQPRVQPPVTVEPVTRPAVQPRVSTAPANPPQPAAPQRQNPTSPLQQRWQQLTNQINQILADGVQQGDPARISTLMNDFANNRENNLPPQYKDGLLSAAQTIGRMSPQQLDTTLQQRSGVVGDNRTVREFLTSQNPRDQMTGTILLARQAMIYEAQQQPQPGQQQQPQPGQQPPQGRPPQPGVQPAPHQQPQPQQNRAPIGNNTAAQVLEAMRSGNARDAGAALHAYANQQQGYARQSRNQNLATTARINHTGANAMEGPAGQRMMENALNTSVGHGKTVRDMLNSNNPNTQNLAAAYVCNVCAGQGRYARNNMQGLQLASNMEGRLGGIIPPNPQPHGVRGGDHAHEPQQPTPQGQAPQPPAPRRGIW